MTTATATLSALLIDHLTATERDLLTLSRSAVADVLEEMGWDALSGQVRREGIGTGKLDLLLMLTGITVDGNTLDVWLAQRINAAIFPLADEWYGRERRIYPGTNITRKDSRFFLTRDARSCLLGCKSAPDVKKAVAPVRAELLAILAGS